MSEREDGDLGRNTLASTGEVAAARRAFSAALELPPIVDVRQVHGVHVQVVGAAPSRDWFDLDLDPDARVEADAIVVPDHIAGAVAAAVLVADCVPIALVAGDAFAVVHAGWRGLVGGVVEASLDALTARAGGVAATDVAAVLGPAIGPCCFEVGAEVAAHFASDDVVRELGTRPHVDLWSAVERRLRGAGVTRVDRIGGCTRCTRCASGGATTTDVRWHSYRRDGSVAGRIALVAWRTAARIGDDLLQGH